MNVKNIIKVTNGKSINGNCLDISNNANDSWCELYKFNNDDEKVQLLIAYLRKMNDDLNIPHCIKNYGADSYPCENGFVPEEVFLERLPEIAKNAIGDACTGSNPRIPTQEEMEKLLKCCYYDTEVDF